MKKGGREGEGKNFQTLFPVNTYGIILLRYVTLGQTGRPSAVKTKQNKTKIKNKKEEEE